MPVYAVQSENVTADDVTTIQKDISQVLSDQFIDTLFTGADKQEKPCVSLSDVKGAGGAAGVDPKTKTACDAVEKSFLPLASVQHDVGFCFLGDTKLSKGDLSNLGKKLESIHGELVQSEQIRDVALGRFDQITKLKDPSAGSGSMSRWQLDQFLKHPPADLKPHETEALRKLQGSFDPGPMSKERLESLPHDVNRKHSAILSTAVGLWKDLPGKSYVPERQVLSPLTILADAGTDLLRNSSGDKLEKEELATKRLDAAAKQMGPLEPRFVPRALNQLSLALDDNPHLAQTERFQKVAAMLGAPQDRRFMETLARHGVDKNVRHYYEQYSQNKAVEYDSGLYGPLKSKQ